MIEKIMRAVKSSNKKRGRNITIGAVVGMLLSCTAVMGANGDYLWIRNNNGTIEAGTGGNWTVNNPYDENKWNRSAYINNITLSGTDNGQDKDGNVIGYGLKLSGNLGKNFNFVNNGIISGAGTTTGSNSNSGYGVYLENSTMRDIGNNGIISGSGYRGYGVYLYNTTLGDIGNAGIISGSGSGYMGYGVYLADSTLGDIVNIGIIAGTNSGVSSSNSTLGDIANIGIISGISTNSNSGYGVYLLNSIMGDMENNGIIAGSSTSSGSGYGVSLSSTSTSNTTVKSIVNTGIISGTNSSSSGTGVSLSSTSTSNTTVESIENNGIISGSNGYGVYLFSYPSPNTTVESIVNKGIIYGTTNAIRNNGGKITKAHNYGLLMSGSDSVVKNVNNGTVNFIKNFGLIFNAVGDEYTIDDTFGNNFGKKLKKMAILS